MNANSSRRLYALEVYRGRELVFHHDGRWLHPLFELEAFLQRTCIDPSVLRVSDKIVGRAAALLLVRLGVGRVEADLMSELARQALSYHGMPHAYRTLVPRIQCKTETLLKDDLDPTRAYECIKARIEGLSESSR